MLRICSACGAIANGKVCSLCGSVKITETSNHCVNLSCKKYNKPLPKIAKFCEECGELTNDYNISQ